MMRTPHQPLADLVDAAALRWLAVEQRSGYEQETVREEITRTFGIGDKPELTYHGSRYMLTVSLVDDNSEKRNISVHEKALEG